MCVMNVFNQRAVIIVVVISHRTSGAYVRLCGPRRLVSRNDWRYWLQPTKENRFTGGRPSQALGPLTWLKTCSFYCIDFTKEFPGRNLTRVDDSRSYLRFEVWAFIMDARRRGPTLITNQSNQFFSVILQEPYHIKGNCSHRFLLVTKITMVLYPPTPLNWRSFWTVR